jgi:hypothetical protein
MDAYIFHECLLPIVFAFEIPAEPQGEFLGTEEQTK